MTWKNVRQELMVSYSLINIFRLLWISKFKISFRYIPRFLWALVISTITLPLRIIEKIRFDRKIKRVKLSKDPVFIIGFYRTATTLLHMLLAMDTRLGYLSNLDGFIPLFNLSFSRLGRRILEKRLPKTRPMDNIEMHVDSPQEEEYALATFCTYGISNAIIFPQNFKYFTKFLTFEDCPSKDLARWKQNYHYIVQKTTLKNEGKQLVLKNPANACRITYLLEMYPNAKFVYQYRNPYTLFPSMKILFQKLMEISALQIWDENMIENIFLEILNSSFSVFERTKSLIPPENFYALKYEDFIANPLPYLEEIYKKFDLGDFSAVKSIVQDYVQSKSDYQVNIHSINSQSIQQVNQFWDEYREKHGYERLEPDIPNQT